MNQNEIDEQCDADDLLFATAKNEGILLATQQSADSAQQRVRTGEGTAQAATATTRTTRTTVSTGQWATFRQVREGTAAVDLVTVGGAALVNQQRQTGRGVAVVGHTGVVGRVQRVTTASKGPIGLGHEQLAALLHL